MIEDCMTVCWYQWALDCRAIGWLVGGKVGSIIYIYPRCCACMII
jgi:hypothetical protein